MELQAANVGQGSDRVAHFKSNAPKLPIFQDQIDDLDAYINRFERYAEAQHWPREQWSTNLGALLSGKALDTYYQLHMNDANNNDALKEILLMRYQLTVDGFKQKFYNSKADYVESAAE